MGVQREDIKVSHFAGLILMSESIIEQGVARLNIDIAEEFDIKRLSETLRVSTQAISHLLTNLDITYL